MKIERFEDFGIWKESLMLAKEIYSISSRGTFARDFGLRDQIRRAIISVSSNIVEGFERNNNNEFIRFLRIAKGSAGEVRSQLYVSVELGYITQQEFQKMNISFENLGKQIGGFINYLEKKRSDREFIP